MAMICRVWIFLFVNFIQLPPTSSSFVVPSSSRQVSVIERRARARADNYHSNATRLRTTRLYEKNEEIETDEAKTTKKEKEIVWNTSLFPVPAKQFTSTTDIIQGPYPKGTLRTQIYFQTLAALIGAASGVSVAGFKLSIDAIREFSYGGELSKDIPFFSVVFPFYIIPVMGGIIVSLLSMTGEFSPGLRGVVGEVDEDSLSFDSQRALENNTNEMKELKLSEGKDSVDIDGKNISDSSNFDALRPIRKALAAIVTLGTGNSLGPEGPGVEIGAAISRYTMMIWPPDMMASANKSDDETVGDGNGADGEINADMIAERISRNRLLLACGCAAGVSSGFNAPLSGVFFALEVVQSALPQRLSIPSPPQGTKGISSNDIISEVELQQQSLSSNSGSITAILISSVVSALVAREFLGDELALQLLTYDIKTPLTELPIYIMLGLICGCVSVAFSQTAKMSKALFEGNLGPKAVKDGFGSIPVSLFPILGGLTCGGVGYFYPQILFFGYETLNSLLNNSKLPTELLLSLVFAKIFTTAISAGSGLVGGTLAPSLFIGGMTGAAFHGLLSDVFVNFNIPQTVTSAETTSVIFDFAGVPIYSTVGAASVLAAIFDAPLTASLLLFEETRNYDILLPLLASAGIATLSSDIIESKIESST